MKTLNFFTRCSRPILILVAALSVAFSANVHAQTIDIGPNQYAFQFTQNPNFGLFFNSTSLQYEFRNGSAVPIFAFNANNGLLTSSLQFASGSDYLVPNNSYAFRSAANPNYGLFFNGNNLRYEFRGSSGSSLFHVSASNGNLVTSGTMSASGGTSDEWNQAHAWGDHAAVGYINAESDPKIANDLEASDVPSWNGSQLVSTVLKAGNSSATITGTPLNLPIGSYAGNLLRLENPGAPALGAQTSESRLAFSKQGTVIGRVATFDNNIRFEATDGGNIALSAGNIDRMTILPNGNVGLGLTDPDHRLQVSGTIRATSVSYAIRGSKTGSGTFPGVWGETESTSNNASGVRGYVLAESPGSGSAGVLGRVLATGTNNNGSGVKGVHDASGVGVYGESTDGFGIFGATSSNSIAKASIRGERSVGNYIYGELGAVNEGAVGAAYTSSGIGVLGISPGGVAGYFSGNTIVTGIFSNPSDEKLKTNINELDKALARLSQLSPKTYNFKNDEYRFMNLPKGPQFGLISQEVEKVFPELVVESFHRTTVDDPEYPEIEIVHYSGLNYNGFIPILIGGINELTERTTLMSEEIAEQRAQIAEQNAQIESLLALSLDLIEQNKRFEGDLQSCCFSSESGSRKGTSNSASDNASANDAAELGQNIPNPFRESTVIRYYLPDGTGHAMIRITDMGGSPVQDLQLGAQRGANQIEFQTQGLAAGTYLYSLFVDGKFIDTKKMVIAK